MHRTTDFYLFAMFSDSPSASLPVLLTADFLHHEFPWVLAYPIPGPSQNRLLMPFLFYYQKNSPAVLFPLLVLVKCCLSAHSSAKSFLMNFEIFYSVFVYSFPLSSRSRISRPRFRTFAAVFCFSGKVIPQDRH